jgi:inner membrane protein
MDSLSQIILGSATAEAALGRKVGNRAMVWGAIAGTIPDLDIIANAFMSPIDSLTFHRGLTHAFWFEILMAAVMGWAVHKLYSYPQHKKIGQGLWYLIIIGIGVAIIAAGGLSLNKSLIGLLWIVGLGYLIYRRYQRESYDTPVATRWEWQKMFFWSLMTHPILDCFTTYGTQFFTPLSNTRVAFNNIAVADPMYTIPFMICLIVAIFLPKGSLRAKWNNAGLIISSTYMILTLVNKYYINELFVESLAKEKISYSRYMTTPSILNNILWSGIAESDSAYYYGSYSHFDDEKKFVIHKKSKTPLEISNTYENDVTLNTLKWFSDGYYVMEQGKGDTLYYYDMRFGAFRMREEDNDSFVFKMDLVQEKENTLRMLPENNRGPEGVTMSEVFRLLWRRVFNIKD